MILSSVSLACNSFSWVRRAFFDLGDSCSGGSIFPVPWLIVKHDDFVVTCRLCAAASSGYNALSASSSVARDITIGFGRFGKPAVVGSGCPRCCCGAVVSRSIKRSLSANSASFRLFVSSVRFLC